MEKKFKVLPPSMPNYVRFEMEPSTKQEGFKTDQGYDIGNFTPEEALEYAELMKESFISHWRKRKELLNNRTEG